MKKRVFVLVLLLFLVGIFSLTISFDGFFFTTKFYEDPLRAYNAGATYNAIYGDTHAEREVGVVKIDEEKALFIGELSNDCFIVAGMNIKNEKYAFDGTKSIFEYSNERDVNAYKQTKTKSGYVKWTIACDKKSTEELVGVKTIMEYTLSDGRPLLLIVFD
ncbi:MAG: hypothetical protein E7267_06775 [Lachnospiraceae bacterium]|nr:hypothetical protein [Lachnospiraceae bacterium]